MDSNETMKKVLDRVDHFVDEFVGNDLRGEVFHEAKKQIELENNAKRLMTLTGNILQNLVAWLIFLLLN